ncbi:hypothetical protein GCM10011383_41470 [Hymenobacter cavernae]|uniref:Uncharacterized protein n=1 Tax=Hymenobacter cavernae TaxID=2044852 RepID=A0ABQ1US99_9BACT|nr:hypothetical protein GCM10011383_41470 [Hymenobacter cavernae]
MTVRADIGEKVNTLLVLSYDQIMGRIIPVRAYMVDDGAVKVLLEEYMQGCAFYL